jgi:hypothetical protein
MRGITPQVSHFTSPDGVATSGGAVVVEIVLPVPGNYTLLDHSIFRIEKGASEWCQCCDPAAVA